MNTGSNDKYPEWQIVALDRMAGHISNAFKAGQNARPASYPHFREAVVNLMYNSQEKWEQSSKWFRKIVLSIFLIILPLCFCIYLISDVLIQLIPNNSKEECCIVTQQNCSVEEKSPVSPVCKVIESTEQILEDSSAGFRRSR